MLSNTCTKLNRQSLRFQSHDNACFFLFAARECISKATLFSFENNKSEHKLCFDKFESRTMLNYSCVFFFINRFFFFVGFQCMWSFDCCHLKLLAIGVYAIYSTAPWCSMSTLYKAIHFIVNWIEESYANSSKQQPMNVFFFWCLFFFLFSL